MLFMYVIYHCHCFGTSATCDSYVDETLVFVPNYKSCIYYIPTIARLIFLLISVWCFPSTKMKFLVPFSVERNSNDVKYYDRKGVSLKKIVPIKPRGLLHQRVIAVFNLLKVKLGRIVFKYDYICMIPLTLNIRV